jgi:Ca2+-binding EF-hand superfamily protein
MSVAYVSVMKKKCLCHYYQEFQKKIQEAFEVFDHEHNNAVDVREIGTIIRSLGKFEFS